MWISNCKKNNITFGINKIFNWNWIELARCLQHHNWIILTNSPLQRYLNSSTLGRLGWTVSLRSYNSILIGLKYRLWIGHSKIKFWVIQKWLCHSASDYCPSAQLKCDWLNVLYWWLEIHSLFHQVWQVSQVITKQSSPNPYIRMLNGQYDGLLLKHCIVVTNCLQKLLNLMTEFICMQFNLRKSCREI